MTGAQQPLANAHYANRADKASAFSTAQQRFEAGRLGMFIFLVSLSVLFIAGLVGYAIIRLQLPHWPQDLPGLPLTLLASTMVLIVSSCTLQAAIISIRDNVLPHTASLMGATTALGLLFLVTQAFAWSQWFSAIGDQWPDSQAYRWALASFYVLTGIHALHVLGGIAPMIVTTVQAVRRRYSADDYAGIYYCAMYWHFLGVVWMVLYATLLIGT